LFNNTFDAIFVINEKKRLHDVNDCMLQMFNISDKNIALKYTFDKYTQNLELSRLDKIMKETFEGLSQLFECKCINPVTSDSFDAEITFRSTQWYGQKAIIAMVRDISFRKQSELALLERERLLSQQNEELINLNQELADRNQQVIEINEKLRKANQKAIESDRLKSAFLANMSHEIRTPMNGIIGFASLLAEPDNNKEVVQQYVDIINSCSHQLLTIIDDIIDFSKIEAGVIYMSPQPTKINKLLNEVYSLYIRKCPSNLLFKIEKGLDDGNCTIMVDPDRLKQVIGNLVSNAIKFTSKGSITMGYEIDQEIIRFYVNDTGIGIEHKYLQTIFKRFEQGDTGKTRMYGGTGLGLAICKAIVKRMGGKIRVKSQLSQGSTFYVELPFIQPITQQITN
jgi:signal transduction histidine kinase